MVYLPTILLAEVGTIVRRKYLPDSIKCRASGSINVPVLYDLARVVVTVIMTIIGYDIEMGGYRGEPNIVDVLSIT
jgi:hypothetical protein